MQAPGVKWNFANFNTNTATPNLKILKSKLKILLNSNSVIQLTFFKPAKNPYGIPT